ncbi:flippase [Candidatus Woesearchaeota archaeon]|nr:flippase [Candidatus Woesearchaeota archaeon]
MGSVRRIAANTVFLSIAEVAVKIAQFFIFVYVARQLGNAVFGRFNFAYSFSLIAVIFIDIGINYMVIREISIKKEMLNKFISNSLIIKTGLGVIVFILSAVALNFLNYPKETRILVYLLLAYMFLRSNTEFLFSVFKAFERMHYEALIKVLGVILILIFGIAGLMFTKNIIVFGLIYALIEFFVFLVALTVVIKKFTTISLEFDFAFAKTIIKLASPFTLSMIFAGIYFYIDTIMLSLMKGDVPVGIYSAAYNITLALLFIPGMYTFAIYPILSSSYLNNKRQVKFIYERSFKYLYIFGLPLSIGLFIIARNAILFMYGQDYSQSVVALKILAGFIVFKFLSYLIGTVLSSINKQKFRMYGQGISALLNLSLNLVLIPRFSFVGAGIATLISEIFLFIFTFIFVSKYFHSFNVLAMLYKPLIASVTMSLAIIFLKINMFALIIVGAAVYFTALFLLKAFDEKDYSLMRRLIKISSQKNGI